MKLPENKIAKSTYKLSECRCILLPSRFFHVIKDYPKIFNQFHILPENYPSQSISVNESINTFLFIIF